MSEADRLWADDLEAGQVYRFGTHHVTEEELLDFARTWDPQDFHTDKAAAEAGAYGGLIASGLHTMSIYQKNWPSPVSCTAGRSSRASDLPMLCSSDRFVPATR